MFRVFNGYCYPYIDWLLNRPVVPLHPYSRPDGGIEKDKDIHEKIILCHY